MIHPSVQNLAVSLAEEILGHNLRANFLPDIGCAREIDNQKSFNSGKYHKKLPPLKKKLWQTTDGQQTDNYETIGLSRSNPERGLKIPVEEMRVTNLLTYVRHI